MDISFDAFYHYMSYLAFPVVAMERQVICLSRTYYTHLFKTLLTLSIARSVPLAKWSKFGVPTCPGSASALSVLSTIPSSEKCTGEISSFSFFTTVR